MNSIATRVSSRVGQLGPDTTFTVLDLEKPAIAATGLITAVVELTAMIVAGASSSEEDANHAGDYLW